MKINLHSKNLELTNAIHNYVVKRITNLEKLLSRIEQGQGEITASFEVSRSTNHHKAGDVFHADCLIKIDGKKFYSSADKEDLYEAVDSVKDSLYNEISKHKDRTQTMFTRGARSVKKMLKGLSKRNPFTSKY
ncbi:ribosomal subunit interface protein [Candidatus Nomurabacteria bacterium CG10_big_fil_rev_8_21_14_0_10_35_16]|uniref:Ribosomal subunit interface protein n=1 Tax=Candidatus Nomurabacteria bacterium CG10_big_fil_rev_8_21_14_0_10_35_16 TaxID=1974731 RepID=A0A2H0TB56_9BACT|nr:MAG: ribosomal subunit interface protein [Candidatus Nomurabacteria bacterium CG10_big_fil_rev_8_21_14_0_10_35_16]